MLSRCRFLGVQSQSDSNNVENVMSCTGYVMRYAGYAVLWCSKLQIEITLSTIEAEYIALSQSMREVITFIALMKEVYFIFDINLTKPEVFCKLFEYNQSCIYFAESNKLSPIKKHISVKEHHF